MANIIEQLEQEQIAELTAKRQIPKFAPGDTLRVKLRITEGTRERVQTFEAVCIARSGKGFNQNFTMRKISYGEGLERVFPLYSPLIESIEVVRYGDVRRAKLYYLRGRTGKRARIAEKQDWRRQRDKEMENKEAAPEPAKEEPAATNDAPESKEA
jgi:large subunit ribosomal protein L19